MEHVEAPPADLIHTYNIVHIRLVNIVIANKDPVSTIRNLAALFKPVGYIQWDEIDLGDNVVAHVDGDAGKMDAIRKMNGLMKGHGSWEWIVKLQETMKENGFEEAKLWRLKPDMCWAKFSTDCHMLSFAEIASRLPEGHLCGSPSNDHAHAIQPHCHVVDSLQMAETST